MMTPRNFRLRDALAALALCTTVGLASCTDSTSTDLSGLPQPSAPHALTTVPCTASLVTRTVACGAQASLPGGASASIIGGQNVYVRLASSNVSYDSTTEIFQFDVTVQNLLNEAMGTPDGTVPDPDGIQVFFHSGPTATGGSGTITVANADGTGTFTGSGQPYFAYHEILTTGAVSAPHTWQLSVPPTVTTFAFTVYIETDVQYLLVINEVMVNPSAPTVSDANREWFEVYNAGTLKVEMQNLVIADSAASGRRPYHLISSSLVVPAGGYVTLGASTNTTDNGGVPIDYAYGSALSLANSLDAIKIARVVGTDTLTIDRTAYGDPGVSAQNGISRELTNPALDNSDMDDSNWADASVTAVYGPGGRGTPKAQNSTFTP
jgi:hypothetical protein